ncbi:MAG: GspE/PulE family protein [Calditrichia bacterium]
MNSPPQPSNEEIIKKLSRKIPHEYALQYLLLPIRADANSVCLATTQALQTTQLEELTFLFDCHIDHEIWPEEQILETIAMVYGVEAKSADAPAQKFAVKEKQRNEEHVTSGDGGVIEYVNRCISDAIRMRASDIHVECEDQSFRIRMRIDGKLTEYDQPALRPQAVVSRLKIMAELDIAEKRRPQDGRIRMSSNNRTVDMRVSTLPTDFGEKVVLRILDKSALNLSLDSLNMEATVLADLKKVLRMPNGMVLVTGPTGSGKTTTLYAGLNYLNQSDVNIVTIEDPIEYNLEGINQTMVRADIGLTFASILRTVLRQDPDIIMLGEIRDGETAEIAIRSALTGHMVLSTLHTNDAISTIARLMDMGTKPFLVANSLRMILAQRLVRRICKSCQVEDPTVLERYTSYSLPSEVKKAKHFRGAGCNRCHQSGYSGRMAILESLVIDAELADFITRRVSVQQLTEAAWKKGFRPLQQAGYEHVISGETTLDEVIGETWVL